MKKEELRFIPHSDTSIAEVDIIKQHNNLIQEGKYEEAITILNDNQFVKGMRASLFNSIVEKIRKIQLYLLNEFVAESYEYFSDTEPTDEEMGNKTIWVQPWY